APYELHQELARRLDATQPHGTVVDDLSRHLLKGQQLAAKFLGDPNYQTLTEARQWVLDVEEYIKATLGPAILVRFRQNAFLPPPRHTPLVLATLQIAPGTRLPRSSHGRMGPALPGSACCLNPPEKGVPCEGPLPTPRFRRAPKLDQR